MATPEIFHSDRPFTLESSATLPSLDIAYHTYGSLNAARDNVVWVCHALTANSDVADWWPHTVEDGCFLDPADRFIICANIIGSCYGSTGPLSVNPATGEPYYTDFPRLTIRDIVAAHRLLADALGIGRIAVLVGSSVGGFQAIEWAVSEPERFDRLILIATDAKASPWAIAIDETQRMAIKADRSYGERRHARRPRGRTRHRPSELPGALGLQRHPAGPQRHAAPRRRPPRRHIPALSGRKALPPLQRLLLRHDTRRLRHPRRRLRPRRCRPGPAAHQRRHHRHRHQQRHYLHPPRDARSRRHDSSRRLPRNRFGLRPRRFSCRTRQTQRDFKSFHKSVTAYTL